MPDFCVKKAVSDFVHKQGLNIASDAYAAINKAIEEMIEAAAKRAKANKRKTIMAHDF